MTVCKIGEIGHIIKLAFWGGSVDIYLNTPRVLRLKVLQEEKRRDLCHNLVAKV